MAETLQERVDVACSAHTVHDQAFNELIRSAVAVIGLSIAPADTPDLGVKQTGAGLRMATAARDFALAVDTLPESERPIGWKSLIPAERLHAALVQLREEARDMGDGLYPDAVRFGLSKAIAVVTLAIGGSSPESSAPATRVDHGGPQGDRGAWDDPMVRAAVRSSIADGTAASCAGEG